MEYALGIDIGGTNTKLGLVTRQGELLSSESIPTQSEQSFDEFVERVYLRVNEWEFSAIGVGAPNANSQTGRIEHPPNLNWEIENLVAKFSERFNKPVFLENDANVAAYGERTWGQGREFDDFVVVTLGTGVGSGIFSSGRLITSYNGMATEAGHLIVEPHSGRPCNCGGSGHLEAYASVGGLVETVKELTGEQMQFDQILGLFQSEDKKITEAVKITSGYLAVGLSQIFALFLPKKIILSGGMSNLGSGFCDLVAQDFRKLAYPPFKDSCQISISKISLKDGAVLGAASLVFS